MSEGKQVLNKNKKGILSICGVRKENRLPCTYLIGLEAGQKSPFSAILLSGGDEKLVNPKFQASISKTVGGESQLKLAHTMLLYAFRDAFRKNFRW